MSGVGRIFRRNKIWHIAYYVKGEKGRVRRESSHSTNKTVAEKLLRERLRREQPQAILTLRFSDLADRIIHEYEINQRRSLRRLRISVEHLRNFFRDDRAESITPARIRDYVFSRHEQKIKNATINRELAALKRMFAIAAADGVSLRAPRISKLRESEPRHGFFEHEQFLAIRRHLPAHLKDPVTFLYLSGWRLNEMQTLQWRDVELDHHIIRLRSEHSKNARPRMLVLVGELREVIERARTKRRSDCSFVFHRNGWRLKDFRAAWYAACRRAGVPGRLRHDFRRTAVRNLIRAGVPDKVAMATTGHLTRSVLDRYNIVSEQDLAEAQEKLANYLERRQGDSSVRKRSRL